MNAALARSKAPLAKLDDELAVKKEPLANELAEFAVMNPAFAVSLAHESAPPPVFACEKAALACANAALAFAYAEGTKEEKSLVESSLDGGTCVDINYSLFILFI